MASGQNKVLATQEHITFGIWIIKKRPPRVKSMKYIITLALFGTLSASAFSQDLQTLIFCRANPSDYQNSGSVVSSYGIPAGKTIEVISITGSIPIYVVYGVSNFTGVSANGYADSSLSVGTIAGPASIFVQNTTGFKVVTFRLKDNTSTTETVPTSAVVIPSDATGPVNVILESSSDLVTWTQANPGTYGSSTSKRFFRVRAVNQ